MSTPRGHYGEQFDDIKQSSASTRVSLNETSHKRRVGVADVLYRAWSDLLKLVQQVLYGVVVGKTSYARRQALREEDLKEIVCGLRVGEPALLEKEAHLARGARWAAEGLPDRGLCPGEPRGLVGVEP